MLPVGMVRQNAKERLLKKVKEKVLLTCQKGLLNRTLIGDLRPRGVLLNICFYYQITVRSRRWAES